MAGGWKEARSPKNSGNRVAWTEEEQVTAASEAKSRWLRGN